MALFLGSVVPAGNTTGDAGDTMQSRYAPQFDFEIGAGAKASKPIYIGGYTSVAVGGMGNDTYTSELCSSSSHDVSCSSDSARFGVEVQYHFVPAGLFNPWVGYGLAYELAWQEIDDHVAARTETSTVSGFQYGRFEAGVDLRLGRVIGLGAYFHLDLGRYTHETTSVNGRDTYSGGIAHTATHTWLGTGLRMVFFP